MKVAISTDHGSVSAHFGRCAAYTLVEIEQGKVVNREEIPNPGHSPGFLPRYLSEKGVECIIAGGMGPRAQNLFAQKNIQTLIGVQGPVDQVIQKFISQELQGGEDLCAHKEGHKHPENPPQTSPSSKKWVCIPSKGPELEAEVDPNFGRAPYYLMVEPSTLDYKVVENPHKEAARGAGIQAAQLVSGKNVKTVLAGNCGPNAQNVLQSSGIQVQTGFKGTVKQVLSKYR
ncbi:NifB/NifX family molybdenum-iron cluster-binding protein [bacterium]|nr:NifB/NifX family molybdenum-iron cluster-binding protein [bacterium]